MRLITCAIYWLMLLCALCNDKALAANDEIGLPLLDNFKPRDYSAGTQNWAVLQDDNGLLYVGNNIGILEYDGVTWRSIQTENKSVVRSLALAADGRIYVGAKGEIGFLANTTAGPKSYFSLNNLLPQTYRNFQDVRQTFVTPYGVFFISREYVFLLQEDRFRVWPAKTAFLKAFWVNQRLLLRERDSGLLEWKNGQFRDVPQGHFFKNKAVYLIEPYSEGELLIGTRHHGLFLLSEHGVTPWPTNVDQQLAQAELYSGLTLQNGHYALGTVHEGLFILGRDGQLIEKITKASGLYDQNIRALFQDHQGGLWLALDHGISRLAMGAALSVFNSHRGLEGNVFALHRHANQLYAGTSLGLFKLQGSEYGTARFERLEAMRKQTWDFLDFQQQLLVATSSGLYQLHDDKLALIRPSAQATKVLAASVQNPQRLYIGLQDGLASMRYVDGIWQDEGKIAGITGNLNSIVETTEGELWVGTLANGIYRIKLPLHWSGGNSVPLAIAHYNKEDGLPSINRNTVHSFNGKLYFATVRGMYRFDPQTTKFQLDPMLGAIFNDEQPWIRNPVMDNQGRIWMLIWDNLSGTRHAGVALPQANGRYTWSASSLQSLYNTPLDTILLEQEELVWFGGAEGVFRFASNQFQSAIPKPPLLRQVVTSDGTIVFEGGHLPESLTLAAEQNNLRFNFTSPNYNKLDPELLQVRLFGHDKKWLDWHHENYRDFTNLDSGDYRFEIRSRNAAGHLSNAAPFHFRISRPWYLQYWVIAAYIGISALLLYALMKWRTHHLLREQQRLAKLIAERTAHLEETLIQRDQAREKAEAATLAKSQFLANISHELRTPLNAVLGFAELAQQTPQPQRKQEYLTKIRTAGKILLSIINDLLDLSKIEAGKLDLEAVPFNLASCLQQVTDLFSAQIEQKKLQFSCTIEPGIPTQLVGDPLRLSQILINLLSNAIKFTEHGQIRLTVTQLSTDDKDIWLTFCLSDTGIGISAEQQQLLFQAFSQANSSVSRKYGGTGLGLVICQRLVQLMKGNISLESIENKGSHFSFSACFTKAPTLATTLTSASPPNTLAPALPSNPILVVDDNYFNQQLLQLMLEKLGYKVLVASSGDEALILLQCEAVSVILLDIEMPGLNGYQTLAAIRALHQHTKTPVLAMTAHTRVQLGLHDGAQQFDDVITKPINLGSLQQQIQTQLNTTLSAEH